MTNLIVENIQTRQLAKELTRKNGWRLLGMMLLTSMIAGGVMSVGMTVLMTLTGAQYFSQMQSYYSYGGYADLSGVGTVFFVGYALVLVAVSVVSSGMNLGLIYSVTSVARGEEKVSVGRVFDRMQYILKGFALNLWVGLKIFLWMLPAILVMVLVLALMIPTVSADPYAMSRANSATVVFVSILPLLTMVAMAALALPAALRYYMSTYILANHPETGVFDCVNQSKAMMNGHKWQLFKLCIPYLLKMYGWMFLLMLGIFLLTVVMQLAESAAMGIIGVLLIIALFVMFFVKMFVYALRAQVAMAIFYLKRAGETPNAAPAEKTLDMA